MVNKWAGMDVKAKIMPPHMVRFAAIVEAANAPWRIKSFFCCTIPFNPLWRPLLTVVRPDVPASDAAVSDQASSMRAWRNW
jgi:hypothetical protein